MKTNLIAFLILFIISSCNLESDYSSRPKTAEELKAELHTLELNMSLSYLDKTNVTLTPQQKQTRRAGLFRHAEYAPDGALIEGNFINKATLAYYKDIVVKISYYSQTETLIKEETYILYEYYPPNTTKKFSIKIKELPQAFVNFSFNITGATPVYN